MYHRWTEFWCWPDCPSSNPPSLPRFVIWGSYSTPLRISFLVCITGTLRALWGLRSYCMESAELVSGMWEMLDITILLCSQLPNLSLSPCTLLGMCLLSKCTWPSPHECHALSPQNDVYLGILLDLVHIRQRPCPWTLTVISGWSRPIDPKPQYTVINVMTDVCAIQFRNMYKMLLEPVEGRKQYTLNRVGGEGVKRRN